jgi:hypothetical protein
MKYYYIFDGFLNFFITRFETRSTHITGWITIVLYCQNLIFCYNIIIQKRKTKARSDMNTKVEVLLCEVESIIACVETVIELLIDDQCNTEVLEAEEFEHIRYIAEELQDLVVECSDKQEDFTTNCDCEDESINLYQQVKYCLEALEESITNESVLEQFGYIRKSVNSIRNLFA